MNLKYRPILLASACGAAVLGLAAPVAAQQVAQAAPPPAAGIAEIVVTGSRVMNGNASTVPTTVINPLQLTAIQPGPIAQAIQSLPVFVGANNSTSGNYTGGTTLDLRFQGPNATLVLFDGKRLAPTTYDQRVDANTVPQMLLQRVDVVTGGASSVYGSDAVAGVVNFVTDRNYNGFQAHVQGTVAGTGLNPGADVGFAAGTSLFGGRGHFEGSIQFQNSEGVPRRSQLPWGRDNLNQFGAGTAAAPYQNFYHVTASTSTFGGKISAVTGGSTPASLVGMTFDQNGVLSPFVNGQATGVTGVQSGGDGAYNDGSAAPATTERQVFGRFDYDLTDTTHAFVEGTYNYNSYSSSTYDEDFANLVFSGQNPYLPTANQFNGTFALSKYDTQLGRQTVNANEGAWFVIAGLEGRFGGWKWEASFNEASSTITNNIPNQINMGKLYAALDAVTVTPANVGTSGQTIGSVACRVTLTNPGLYSGCTPYNMFGPSAASQAAMSYITQPTHWESTNTMSDLEGNISGSPFSDWAGPVQVAATAEVRRNTLEVDGNSHPSDTVACTGLVYNCTLTNGVAPSAWFYTTQADLRTIGRNVGEVGVETEIPLLKGLPLIEDLSFNGAFRYTNYQISGGVETWKLGVSWKVVDEFRLRYAQSRDIRAATLYELYQPTTITIAGKSDRLLNLSGHVQPELTQGNPNLVPEQADTTTVGFIYQPHWLPGFSFSVDAFHIIINNVIIELDGAHTPEQNQCIASGGTSPICALQVRALGSYTNTNPANQVTEFYDLFFNADRSETYGADFEANYATHLFDHPLTLRALATWQPHSTMQDPGVAPVEDAGFAFAQGSVDSQSALPTLRGQFIANYQWDNLGIMGRVRWRNTLSNANIAGSVYAEPITIPARQFYDLSFKYAFGKVKWGVDTEAFVNIQNVFDTQPAEAGRNTGSGIGETGGYVPGDDVLGRVFTVGFRFRH